VTSGDEQGGVTEALAAGRWREERNCNGSHRGRHGGRLLKVLLPPPRVAVAAALHVADTIYHAIPLLPPQPSPAREVPLLLHLFLPNLVLFYQVYCAARINHA
jgi:hypothetical protein